MVKKSISPSFKRVFCALMIFVILPMAQLSRAAATYANTQVFSLNGTALNVNITSPFLNVVAWDRTDVEVTISQVGGTAADYAFDVSSDNGLVNVLQLPTSCSQCGRVTITVRQPKANAVTVKVTSGKTVIDGVQGAISLNGSSSPVTLQNVSGTPSVTLTSGPLTVKNSSLAGATFKSSSGQISYTGALVAGGQYKFNSSSGTITANLPSTSSFRVSATASTGAVYSDFVPSGGSVTPKSITGVVGSDSSTSLSLAVTTGRIFIKKY